MSNISVELQLSNYSPTPLRVAAMDHSAAFTLPVSTTTNLTFDLHTVFHAWDSVSVEYLDTNTVYAGKASVYAIELSTVVTPVTDSKNAFLLLVYFHDNAVLGAGRQLLVLQGHENHRILLNGIRADFAELGAISLIQYTGSHSSSLSLPECDVTNNGRDGACVAITEIRAAVHENYGLYRTDNHTWHARFLAAGAPDLACHPPPPAVGRGHIVLLLILIITVIVCLVFFFRHRKKKKQMVEDGNDKASQQQESTTQPTQSTITSAPPAPAASATPASQAPAPPAPAAPTATSQQSVPTR